MISIENSSGRVIVAVAWMMVRIFSAAGRPGRRESSVVVVPTMTMVGAAIPPIPVARAAGWRCVRVSADDEGPVGHLPDRDGQAGGRKQIHGLAEQRERQRCE